jgi:uncharacterized protein
MNSNDVFSKFHTNLDWLKSNTIFLTRHGSHCYGTNTPESDEDFKGVTIPPKQYFLGGQVFEQAELHDPDTVIYDIRKFFKLAADCNPSIIEVLWTDSVDHLAVTELGQKLIDNKDLFISKKAKFTFSGYAVSQMKRIDCHYRWLKSPLKSPPTRKEFGLPERTVIPQDQLAAAESAIKKQLGQWETDFLGSLETDLRIAVINKMSEKLGEMQIGASDQFKAAARTIGMTENFIELLDLERQYKARMQEWNNYQEWKRTRNPIRAELEEKFSFDTKHGTHIVRLVRMCREILETGKIIVKRPDAEELLSIRRGAWSYDQLKDFLIKEDKALDELYKTSTIPHSPNRQKIDDLCIEMVESFMWKR